MITHRFAFSGSWISVHVFIILCVMVLFLIPPGSAGIENLKMTRLSSDQGLSQNTVNTIMEDRYGFLWFGTQDGLNRYDGYSMKVYRSDPSSLKSMSSAHITSTLSGSDGDIWVGTNGAGLNRFNPETEQYTRYIHNPADPHSISHNLVNTLYRDRAGMIWIGTDGGGLNSLDPTTGSFTGYRHNNTVLSSIASDQILHITGDDSGTIWLSTPAGLDRFDPKNGSSIHYSHDVNNPESLGYNQTIASFFDRFGTMWVLSPVGVDRYDVHSENFTHYLFNISDTESGSGLKEGAITESPSGILWMGTRGSGLRSLDPKTGEFTVYPGNQYDPYVLKSDAIRSLHWDRAGALWIGTDDAGVFRYDPRVRQFSVYQNDPTDLNTISSDPLFGILEDSDGILWLGGMDGVLNRLDRVNNTVRRIPPNDTDPHGLAPSRLLGPIIVDSDGSLWLASRGGGGLHNFDPRTGVFTRYSHDPANQTSISDNTILCVYQARDGNIWAGTESGGLNLLNRTDSTFQNWKLDPDTPSGVNSNNIRAIYEDRYGIFWIGTLGGGLNRFDRRNNTFTAYLHDPGDLNSISNNQILCLHVDKNGTLWVGTGQGLNAFDWNGTFRQYTEKDGLLNSCIYGILEDDTGRIWVSTNNGIAALDPLSGKIEVYNRRDGLSSDEYNSGASFQSSAGEMFFGGINGLTAFFPLKIHPNEYIPPVVLTDFEIANRPVPISPDSILTTSISNTNSLALSYLDSVFSFEFSALNYANSGENRFRYRLEGFETEWNEVGSDRRIATYTSLSPGVYSFRVQGSNNDQVWNETGISLSVEISPPWWGTWWFRSLLLLLFAGLLYTLYRVRVRSLKKRSADLEWLVKERTDELEKSKVRAELANQAKTSFMSSMSHELRTPLNAILGYAQILSKQRNLTEVQRDQVGTIYQSGEHLLTIINDILDMGRIESRNMALNIGSFRLKGLIQVILNIIRVKAEEKGLSLRYEEEGSLPEFVRGDERRLRQIFLNILMNAVRYTFEGSIILRLSYQRQNPATLTISVRDTGVGISPLKQEEIFKPFTRIPVEGHHVEGVGLGLAITKELVGLMQGTIHLDSTPGRGSNFIVTIPLPECDTKGSVSSAEVAIQGYSGVRRTILVVDDNTTNTEVLKAVLVPLGFVVHEATDGMGAIKMVREERPDLILLDLVMPVQDGIVVAGIIRSMNDGPLKIIGISATLSNDQRRDAFISICDDFIQKPFILDSLLEKIRAALVLTWIYQGLSDSDLVFPVGKSSDPGIIPPADIIRNMEEAVKAGNIRYVEDIAVTCLEEDSRYHIFFLKVGEFTSRYDDDGLLDYLASVRENEKGRGG